MYRLSGPLHAWTWRRIAAARGSTPRLRVNIRRDVGSDSTFDSWRDNNRNQLFWVNSMEACCQALRREPDYSGVMLREALTLLLEGDDNVIDIHEFAYIEFVASSRNNVGFSRGKSPCIGDPPCGERRSVNGYSVFLDGQRWR